MSNSATIVVKKPGLYVPDELLNTVSSRCPTAFGFAGREGNKLKCEIVPQALAIEELKQLQEAFKDETLVMYFANFPKAVIPDDVMPWSIRVPDENGEHVVMLFAEGDFSAYHGMNGDHTDVSNAFDEVVFPRLSRAMNDADQNLDRFYEELRKPNFQKGLNNAFKDRGVFVILPLKGDIICFGNVPNGLDQPWGSVSNTHGWVPKAEATPKAEAPKPKLSFLRGGNTSIPATKATPDIPVTVTQPNREPDDGVPEPEPSGGDGLPKSGKEVTGINPAIVGKTDAQLEAAGWRKTFPPPKLAKGKARNLWLRVFNGGHLPPNHESSQCTVWTAPDIIDLSNRTASSKGEVENIAYQVNQRRKAKAAPGDVSADMAKAHDLAAEAEATASAAAAILAPSGKGVEKPITNGKSTVREKHVPSTAASLPSGTPSAGSSPYLPTMTEDEKLKAMLVLDEYFDPKNTKRPNALEIQKGASKHASFSQATGRNRDDILFLPVKTIYELVDGHKIAVAMIVELRRRLIEESGIKLEDLIQTPKTEGEVTPQTEQPKVSVPEVPVKKSSNALGFLRGKTAA